jgi:hypothetical protein
MLTFILGTACVAGLWLYSKFRPLILWGKGFAGMTPVQASSLFGPA